MIELTEQEKSRAALCVRYVVGSKFEVEFDCLDRQEELTQDQSNRLEELRGIIQFYNKIIEKLEGTASRLTSL